MDIDYYFNNTNVEPIIAKPPTLMVQPKKPIEKVKRYAPLEKPEAYYDIVSSMNREQTAVFTKFPDFSKLGRTIGTIEVTETTSDGYSQKTTVNIPFEVEATFEAKIIPQEAILGNSIGQFDLNKSVKGVLLEDDILSPEEYTITIIGDNNKKFNQQGLQTRRAVITAKESGKTLAVDLPFNVKWGSTVLLRGYGDNSIGAITLHQTDSGGLLTDSEGIIRDPSEKQVHKYFPGQTYYDLRLLGPTVTSQNLKELKPVTKENSLTWGDGDAIALDRIHAFGDNADGQQKVNLGEILEVTHTEAQMRERLIVNEKEIQENDGQKTVYYELTHNGFNPLRVNQLKPKKGTIPLYSSETYLAQHITEYIDLKDYKNIEVKTFTTYPVTNKSGETSGKILVEETLQSGKKVCWEYEVAFTVLEGNLDLSTPDILTFETFSPAMSEQIIQRKDTEDSGLTIKDSRGNGKQGGWYLTAQVYKDTAGISPYLIFAKKGQANQYLTDTAKIYSQAKQENSSKRLEVKVTASWKNDEGILLQVPARIKLESNKVHSETIHWNLVEGP